MENLGIMILEVREYPENATTGWKRALRRLKNHFFLNGDVLYRRTPNLGLLSDLIREICGKFKIVHHNSTAYMPQMNGSVEAPNKNIKRILREIVDSHSQWHVKLPFALLGYRTMMRTSIGATLYMLVYGT
ncbi:uncharacterized protein LOC142175240 [Nicotiana tabacum]|uniref:Uncharacterized protein LOC142175240 n=1 Tax=Nicotiana tabacum TaxID=4097 RepID=A0AC58TL33_TOBAC